MKRVVTGFILNFRDLFDGNLNVGKAGEISGITLVKKSVSFCGKRNAEDWSDYLFLWDR